MIAILLVFFAVLFTTPAACAPEGPYTATIASADLSWIWGHPQNKVDYFAVPRDWDDLPVLLQRIAIDSGGRPIVLDFHVHGYDRGLILCQERPIPLPSYMDRCTFGWLLNQIETALAGRSVAVLMESCYAGRAYHYSIRNETMISPRDNIGDYEGIPSFPIYGTGDSFSNVGNIMFLQWKYRFRNWWVSLSDYDPEGLNRPLMSIESTDADGYSVTSRAMKKVWAQYRQKFVQ